MSDLFRKVLLGTASAAEQQALRSYLESGTPDLQALLPFEDWDTEEDGTVWTEAEREAWYAKIISENAEVPVQRRLRFKKWLPYAAALIAGIIAFGLWQKQDSYKKELSWISVKAARGAQKEVWLPDSSHITLNAGTELRYPDHFEKNKRQVYLSGEAFFEIRHDEAAPFTVKTPMVDVSVLGTSFNVQAYAEDIHIAVAVKTGKVKVASEQYKNINHILVPGQAVVYNKEDRQAALIGLDTAAVAQWRSRRISLEDATLDHILHVIGRTYDVQFKADNPALLHRKYSITFYDMQLEAVLDKLSYLGGLTFTKKGNQVLVKEQP